MAKTYKKAIECYASFSVYTVYHALVSGEVRE